MKGEKIFSKISIFSILFAILILSGTGIAKVNAQDTNDNLIAEWKFNEGSANAVSDSSGNNYDGELNGGTWIGASGNSALYFNGQSDYISVPSLPVSNVDSLTVVAWINSDLDKTGYIFYHGDTGEFLLHNGERFSDGPVAGKYPDIVSFSVKLAGSTWYDVYSQPLEPNVWHQIVGVWVKGESLKIFVDGTLAGENNAIGSGGLLNDGPFWLPSIGVYNRGAEDFTYYKGLLDDMKIYSTALNSEEVSTLYSNGHSFSSFNSVPEAPAGAITITFVIMASFAFYVTAIKKRLPCLSF